METKLIIQIVFGVILAFVLFVFSIAYFIDNN